MAACQDLITLVLKAAQAPAREPVYFAAN